MDVDSKRIVTALGDRRLSLFPIEDNEVWELYKKAQKVNWVAEEIDLEEDRQHIKKLTEDEFTFVKMVLAFFNASDIIVNANLGSNFLQELDTPEIGCFYWLQGMIENVHSETYSLLLDTYVSDPKEKDRLFNAVETIPSVRSKAAWVSKYFNPKLPLTERLFAFVLAEGLQFSGSFCSIYWFRKRGLLPGLCFSNNLIARDEALHAEFSALMFRRENAKLSPSKRFTQEQAFAMVYECVRVETIFVCDSLKVNLIGMNKELMTQYIKFIADFWLQVCGFEKLYGVKQPFAWMESISLTTKSNFFERRVAEYNKARVGETLEQSAFTTDAEF